VRIAPKLEETQAEPVHGTMNDAPGKVEPESTRGDRDAGGTRARNRRWPVTERLPGGGSGLG